VQRIRSLKIIGSMVYENSLINSEDEMTLEHVEDEACWRSLLK
jgi:hypothetical protein